MHITITLVRYGISTVHLRIIMCAIKIIGWRESGQIVFFFIARGHRPLHLPRFPSIAIAPPAPTSPIFLKRTIFCLFLSLLRTVRYGTHVRLWLGTVRRLVTFFNPVDLRYHTSRRSSFYCSVPYSFKWTYY